MQRVPTPSCTVRSCAQTHSAFDRFDRFDLFDVFTFLPFDLVTFLPFDLFDLFGRLSSVLRAAQFVRKYILK